MVGWVVAKVALEAALEAAGSGGVGAEEAGWVVVERATVDAAVMATEVAVGAGLVAAAAA